jgi:predicted metalloprotease with PDZ domain
MQLRYGMFDLDEFFKRLQEKLIVDARYDTTYSLSKLSLTSYTDEGQAQYGNIYQRGALVAGLLDIRLLELSDGKRGLREVINELSKKYGAKSAFPEAEFFDIFVEMTYPEIADFFELYIKNANPLPIQSYYAKIGIDYVASSKTGKMIPSLGIGLAAPQGTIIITNPTDSARAFGVKQNDVFFKVNDDEIDLKNARMVLGILSQQPIGYTYDLVVKRGDEEITLDARIIAKEEENQHVFTLDEEASAKAIMLRKAWLKNM